MSTDLFGWGLKLLGGFLVFACLLRLARTASLPDGSKSHRNWSTLGEEGEDQNGVRRY